MDSGDFSLSDLKDLDADGIKARVAEAGLEDRLFSEWLAHARAMVELAPKCKSVDVVRFATDNLRFLQLHVGCRGFI